VTEPEHGTLEAYLGGCRCAACQVAYRRQRRRLKAYGRWEPFTDAGPSREHIRALTGAGGSYYRIGLAAGLTAANITCIADSTYGKVRLATEARILAVRKADVLAPSKSWMDGTGTRRRLQALVAAGHTQSVLATGLGMWPTNLRLLLDAQRVQIVTALKVRDLYDRLWNAEPLSATSRQRSDSAAARERARERGWVPPLAWDDDDLDNPAASPAEGWQRSATRPAAEERLADALELFSYGLTYETVAARLGITVNSVERILLRHDCYVLRRAS